MKTRTSSGNSLFLMEMILVILFFAVSAAVCVRVFAEARLRSQNAENLSNAVLAAQEAGECFQAARGSEEELEALLEVPLRDRSCIIYYDAQWKRADTASAFALELTQSANGRGAEIRVIDSADQSEIYAVFVPVIGGAA